MGRVHYLKSIQKIPVPVEEAWAYFSKAENLLQITPAFLNMKVTSPPQPGETYAGQVLTYNVRPLFGITMSWMTEITHVERLKRFVDEQRKGPFTLWHHQHHFTPIEGGTEMTDIVHFRLPLGFLGNMAYPVLVKGQLQKIFIYRYGKVKDLFGGWKGEEMQLWIN
jgi:ligand-binding SRPBCC domain-containing protein